MHVCSDAVDLYVAILGVLLAGAAYLPVDAGDPPARAAAIWEQAGAVAVIEPGLAVRELRPPTLADRSLTAEDEAWLTFASGSSLTPAGVAVTHEAALAYIDAGADAGVVTAHDRVLAAGPGRLTRATRRCGSRGGSARCSSRLPGHSPAGEASGAGGSPSDASTWC